MASTRKVLSWCLFPLTMWYAVVVALRNLLFSLGVLRSEAPHIVTLGVGNLSTGGTGKTPHAEHLLRLLGPHYRTAYLSRGYRRASKGFQLADAQADPRLLGDEAAMVARKFPDVTVAVCEKRTEGLRRLMTLDPPPQVVVLDDVFQHRFVKPTVNILLTAFDRPYSDDLILPFGNLREFRSARKRANMIVLTKTPENLNPIERHNRVRDLGAQSYQKVFLSSLVYGLPRSVAGDEVRPWEEVESVLLFAGVADTAPLERHVKAHCRVEMHRFADHHPYTTEELQSLVAAFRALPGERKLLLTTEKDASRLADPALSAVLQGVPLFCLPVEVKMHSTADFDFDQIILNTVRENVSFLEMLGRSTLV